MTDRTGRDIEAGLGSNQRPGAGGRCMAGARDTKDNPIGRDEYAALLEKGRATSSHANRQDNIHLKAADAYVAAELLDELAAVYKDEHLGRLARELAVTLYDRLGI